MFINKDIIAEEFETFGKALKEQEDSKLRDWYAGMALTGAIGHAGWSYEEVAERAYGIADAMIKARG